MLNYFNVCFHASCPELCLNTAGFAKSVAMLGSSEDNTALSRALSQLAEVEDKMEQIHQDQAANDSFCLAEMLADYIRLLGVVRVSPPKKRPTIDLKNPHDTVTIESVQT